jgi:hypothetical protein
MKSILYAGATLMVAASIFGFVDYKKTSNKKEFTTMYEEKKIIEPIIDTDEKDIVTKIEETKITANAAETKKAGVKKALSKKKKAVTLTKKKRKFDTKLFSRGGLDERFIEPKKIEEVKTDTKIKVIKEE